MNTHLIQIQQQYDQIADRYDQRWRNYTDATLQFLLDWADQK